MAFNTSPEERSSFQSIIKWLFSFEGRVSKRSFFPLFIICIVLVAVSDLVAEALSYPFVERIDEVWYERTGERPRVFNTAKFVSISVGLLVGISAGVRRLHDLNKSGWLVVIGVAAWLLIDALSTSSGIWPTASYVPWWAFSAWLLWKSGDPNPNNYGYPPK